MADNPDRGRISMVMQIRKVFNQLYPDRFGSGRRPGEASNKEALPGKSLRLADDRVSRAKRKHLVYGVVAAVLVSQVFVLAYYYNKFLAMKYNVVEAKAQIDVQLQHRKNIAASLDAIVVSYAKHEKEIFERGIDTRRDLVRPAPAGPKKDGNAQGPGLRITIPGLTSDPSVSRLLAVGESFPGLRLSENYQRLMDALVNVEAKIAENRSLRNQRCNEMTTAITTVPAVWYNRILRFKTPEYYTADADVDKPIKLELVPR